MPMVRVDERFPTHKPAVVCAMCGGDDELIFRNGAFQCRGEHTKHRKVQIPSPYKLRFRKVSDKVEL